MTQSAKNSSDWKPVYRLGGMAAISAVLVGLVEIMITFLPGGNTTQTTVFDWFTLYRENPFMGLRDMGLLNILLNLLAILIYFALYAAFRQEKERPLAMLATLIAFLGLGVFYATNRAFAMLALSGQYAAATTEAGRTLLATAGQAMLAVGQSHTPGTFLGFALAESAGILISFAMLRNRVFGKACALSGILGFSFLLIFEFLASFFAGLSTIMMILAMCGGLLSMAWYILIARSLFQLSREA